MIASIEGSVSEITVDSVIVTTNNIGLKVYVPLETRKKYAVNDRVGLYTTLIVREDAWSLYGFETTADRDMFNLLLTVSGIGPRIALNIISSIPGNIIRKAVITQSPELLEGVSGVGKRSAQNIVVNLQGKLKDDTGMVGKTEDGIEKDVIAALTNLGYSIVEAQIALQQIPRDTPDDIESKLKAALRYFS